MDTEAVVDVTTDIVEAVADNVEAVEVLIKSNPIVIAGAIVGGVAVGAVVSHFITRVRLSLKYEELLNEELDRTRAYYENRLANVKNTRGDTEHGVDKTTIVNVTEIIQDHDHSKKARDISEESGYTPYHKITQVESEEIPSMIRDHGHMDHMAEEKKRAKHQPHIFPGKEFDENEEEYDQVVLTYYEEDQVITGEDDEPITNWREVVGHDNLKFGQGSDDPDVVHIRNDRLTTHYQVFLIESSYAREVLGLDEE